MIKKIHKLEKRYIQLKDFLNLKHRGYYCFCGSVVKFTISNRMLEREIERTLSFFEKNKNSEYYKTMIINYNLGEFFYIVNGLYNLPLDEKNKIIILSDRFHVKQICDIYGFGNNFFYFPSTINNFRITKNQIDVMTETNDTNYFNYSGNSILFHISNFFKKHFNLNNFKISRPVISSDVKERIDNWLKYLGIYGEKICFLSPDSLTVDFLYRSTLLNREYDCLVEKLTRKGYNVLINSNTSKTEFRIYTPNYSYLNGKINNKVVQTCFFNIEETCYLYSQCQKSIQTRSGLTDILCSIDTTDLIVLYYNTNVESIERFNLNKIYKNRKNIKELKGCNIDFMRDLENNKLFNWEENL